MKKLISCPLCGNGVQMEEIPPHKHILAKVIPDHPGSWCIECACGLGLIDEDKERLIKKWNTRILPSCTDTCKNWGDLCEQCIAYCEYEED